MSEETKKDVEMFQLLTRLVGAIEERESAQLLYVEAVQNAKYYEDKLKSLVKDGQFYIVECLDEYAVGTYVVRYENGVFKTGYAVKGETK